MRTAVPVLGRGLPALERPRTGHTQLDEPGEFRARHHRAGGRQELRQPSIPGGLGGCVAPRNATERQAFPDISGALVEIAVDRTQFSGAVQPWDWRAIGTHDLPPFIASRTALRIEHRGRELYRIERLFD